jgi:hypothetical protein
MSENIRDPEMTSLEAALAELAPRSAGINRDQLMYQAGRSAARRNGWLAPGIAAVLASAATVAAVLLVHHPEPQIVRVPATNRAVQPSPRPNTALAVNDIRWEERADALRLRNEILDRGVEALPAPAADDSREPPLTIDRLLH